MTEHDLLIKEMKACFEFFWNESNTDPESPGFGLMIDRSNKPEICSIAAVGFALSAVVIGVKRGFITYDAGLERVIGTLETLLYRVPHYHGFFVHFCDMKTAERFGKSEYSTIDTALCLNGVLTADAFFQNDRVTRLSEALLSRTDYGYFIFEADGKAYFRMAYNDLAKGDYANGRKGFIGQWDMCAEQLMMYIQAAAMDEIDTDTIRKLYMSFDRPYGEYAGFGCYYEPKGVLFVHHYSHAWFDFSRFIGLDGIRWDLNARNAALAQIAWCKDHPEFETFRQGLWGISAFDGPKGYIVHGCPPNREMTSNTDGTIGVCAIAGSLPFTFAKSLEALRKLADYPGMIGPYGFYDSINLDKRWTATTYLGIDKGETLLMISNALYRDIWDVYMKHPRVKKAILRLGMTEADKG
jgi:hypothetical protein